METLNLKKLEGKLKVGGTIILVVGVLIMALLRGLVVLESSAQWFPSPIQRSDSSLFVFRLDHWYIGVLSLVGNCISAAVYLVLQVLLHNPYFRKGTFLSFTFC